MYETATITQKQELVRLEFDNRLYYKSDLYRTPYIMELFSHNLLKMNEQRLLEMDENEKTGHQVRSGGGDRTVIEPLISFLAFIEKIKVA